MNWWRKSRPRDCSRRFKVNLFEKLHWISRNAPVSVHILRRPIGRDECQQFWHTFPFIARLHYDLWHFHYVLTLMLRSISVSKSNVPKMNHLARVFRNWRDEIFVWQCWHKPSEFLWLINVLVFPHVRVYFFTVPLLFVFMFLCTTTKGNANIIDHVSPSVLLSACFKWKTGGRNLMFV